MRKELIYRIVRIVLAMTFGVILFPYLKNSLTEYSNQITLIFLFSSLIVGILSTLIFFLITIIKKKEEKNNLLKNIHYLLRLILLIIFVTYGLTMFKKYWIILILTSIEIYGIFFNEEFERVKEMK